MTYSWHQALQSPDPVLRRQGLQAIREASLTNALPEVVEMLMRDPDLDVRTEAAELARWLAAPERLNHPRDPYGQFRI